MDNDERHSRVRGQGVEQLAGCFEPPGGRSNADDREGEGRGRLMQVSCCGRTGFRLTRLTSFGRTLLEIRGPLPGHERVHFDREPGAR